MNWCCYLLQITVSLIVVIALKIIYFSIKRIYTKTLVVKQNPTEESETYASRENVFNGSSSESLNVELEKKCDSESSKFIHTENNLDMNNLNNLLSDLIHFDTTSKVEIGKLKMEKTMDKDDTVYNGYGSTGGEMPEFMHSKKCHHVLNTCILNSDSRSTIISWKSCNKDIDYPESDYVKSLSSENQKIHQPLNLCIKDNKSEMETNIKNTKTFFTDRKYKNTRDTGDVLMINSEHTPVPIEDEQNILKVWNKLKKQYDILMNTKIHSSILYDKLKNLDHLYDKELHSLGLNIPGKPVYNLENIEDEQKHENRLEITKLSIINHNKFENKDNLENHELESEGSSVSSVNTELSYINDNESENEDYTDETKSSLNQDEVVLVNNLEATELSIINHNESENEDYTDETKSSLNQDEVVLVNNLEATELSIINHNESENEDYTDETKSSLNQDEVVLVNNLELSIINHNESGNEDYTDETKSSLNQDEVVLVNNLEATELSIINHNELENEDNMENVKHELENEGNLDNTELSIINHNELENEDYTDETKSSLNEDEMMLENNLETTEMSSIIQGESIYEYNLESPQLSSLNNDKSISGIDSPNMNCVYDYEVQGITNTAKYLNSTSSSEVTESLPSPIQQTINSIDDIQYVEDYNDISFFDPTLSDDAMNEAFIED